MSCHGVKGAHQHPDVNIGWRLGAARRATEIRTKPGRGEVVGRLDAGDGCGIQTVRNPARRAKPATRPPVKGADGNMYIWIYARDGSDTGWVREGDIARMPANPDRPPLRGPAGLDFEVGRTLPRPKRPSGCGKVSARKPTKTVDAREAHLRYSPRGTSFHYLHRGDRVKVLLANAAQGFHCVQVVKTDGDNSAREGARGWILAEELV